MAKRTTLRTALREAETGTASPMPTMLIPSKIAAAVTAAFQKGVDVYFKKGGIADTRKALDELNEGKGSIGQLLLDVGLMCLEHTGKDHKSAASLFKGACAQTEDKARREAADAEGKKPTVQSLLPTWQAAKTTVYTALEIGLALGDEDSNGNKTYPGIGPVRTAVRQQRAARNTTNNGKAGVTALPAFKSDRLKSAIDVLFKQLILLTEDEQDKGAEDIMTAALAIMGRHQAVTPEQRKEAAQQARSEETADLAAHQAAGSAANATDKATTRRQRMRGGSRAAA